MNLVEHTVTDVLSEPMRYKDTNMWMVAVDAESYGRHELTTVHVFSEEEARKVKVGYKFEA